MIVHQFSAFPYGGAGTAAVRHHLELRQLGIDSQFHYRSGAEFSTSDPSFHELCVEPVMEPRGFWAKRREKARRRRIIREYQRHLEHRSPGGETFSQAEQLEPTCLAEQSLQGALVHLHWMSYLVDFPSFFGGLPTHVPVVWTLHDMNPFTGGCHFSNGCVRFKSGCGQCPQVANAAPRDISHESIRMKQRVLSGRRLDVVAPSRWMKQLAQQSPVWPASTEFHVIPYGLDVRQFRPLAKAEARRKLGVPQNVPLIAFGADDLENPRKGVSLLLRALRQLGPEKGVECLAFGRGQIGPDQQGLPPIHAMGFVNQVEQQVAIYSAADLFVLPSLEDNLPQTGLEAMSCGTPVVGFDVGGIPEFVMPGQTGLLAGVGNVAELAKQISDLIDCGRLRQRLAAGARRLIESEFDARKQTRKYIDLYALLGNVPVQGLRHRAA